LRGPVFDRPRHGKDGILPPFWGFLSLRTGNSRLVISPIHWYHVTSRLGFLLRVVLITTHKKHPQEGWYSTTHASRGTVSYRPPIPPRVIIYDPLLCSPPPHGTAALCPFHFLGRSVFDRLAPLERPVFDCLPAPPSFHYPYGWSVFDRHFSLRGRYSTASLPRKSVPRPLSPLGFKSAFCCFFMGGRYTTAILP
jgi:hypothetical protein